MPASETQQLADATSVCVELLGAGSRQPMTGRLATRRTTLRGRYGDVTAHSHQEQLFSIITMLFGMTLLMGVIMGGWSSILTNYYTQSAVFAHRVDTINACLVTTSISRHTIAVYCRRVMKVTRLVHRKPRAIYQPDITRPVLFLSNFQDICMQFRQESTDPFRRLWPYNIAVIGALKIVDCP